MKIAIIGTRGIPNHYGGFEQFAEYLAKGLVERGHDITVYNSHSHPYQQSEWNGVKLVHCNDPEDKWGTAGQFVYDLNCILHARKQTYDIILQLGYTSSTVWGWLLPRKNCIITTNMDGLEWKRTKYSKPVRNFLKWAEYLGTVYSDHWIADSLGIQDYLAKKYKIPSTYIPYGAFPFEDPSTNVLNQYGLEAYGYNMLIARLEPENNVDTILEGISKSNGRAPFLVVGKHATKYGEYLKSKYAAFEQIRFIGGIYDINALNNLRYYSNVYFHGHSVGGTNPSLLEAMASQALICANQNEFNATILEKDALYFQNANEVKQTIETVKKEKYSSFVANNLHKIKHIYEWNNIIEQYENHFRTIYSTQHEIQSNIPS
ncbi:DUF1972 domain-containing protein [Dyadobacter fermentans]|uniref:DUF1972 domain-containing protein n=1 Tax=Dyadobacter fermentans TaxID=94254 RepID=UPI001CBE1358|nr:DUF1972 domain-containing protein [Dyadobacter fermentans]MBZ1357360.1 DUF1972 domain-containing protein [Dyadobacter fermentans]